MCLTNGRKLSDKSMRVVSIGGKTSGDALLLAASTGGGDVGGRLCETIADAAIMSGLPR